MHLQKISMKFLHSHFSYISPYTISCNMYGRSKLWNLCSILCNVHCIHNYCLRFDPQS